MTTKAQTEGSKLDGIKWVVVFLVVAAGVYGNYYFSSQPLYLRILGELLLAGIAIATALTTAKGKEAWAFILESRSEVRKVVWPTRKETMHTTLIVVVMVILVSLFLWLLDAILARVAAWFIGG